MEKIIDGRQFEWDDMKAMLNKMKHGISFETAILVFEDEYKITRRDKNHSQNEVRWQTIGMVDDVLFVVHTERGEKTRIISAREANERERSDYYGDGNVFSSKRRKTHT